MNKERVRNYIYNRCRGSTCAMKAEAIAKALRISTTELRKHINKRRREGVPIASGSEGYFYAVSAADIYATLKNLEKMKKGLDSAIKGLEAAFISFNKEQQ